MRKDTRKETRDTKEWNQDMWDAYCEILEIPQMELLPTDGTAIEKVDHGEAMKKLRSFAPELPEAEAKAVIHALDELPYLEKDIVLQYFWDGKTVREIAQNLERSYWDIWRRLHRALRTLRKSLQQKIERLGARN